MSDDRPVALDAYPVHQAPLSMKHLVTGDRNAYVMLRVAYRQIHFGEAQVPQDPDSLILHHGSLAAMVQGSYWT